MKTPLTIADLKFYVVQNSEGKFFRRKGYGGYGDTWTDDLLKARIYAKIGPARATITFFANHYPKYPIPVLLEIATGAVTTIDESVRVEKARQKKLEVTARHKEWLAQQRLKDAETALQKAQDQVQKLRGAAATPVNPQPQSKYSWDSIF